MGVYADLHVHTTVSDGRLRLSEVPAAAARAGVDVVAVTDHDRVHPGVPAPVVATDDLTVVRGVELRVATADERVDLLGYGVEATPALRRELDRVQRNRIERARAIADCLEERLGVDLDVAFQEGVGRPHLARAVANHPDLTYDVGEVFAELIGADGPCYVPRDVTDFETGRELLEEACAVVALAHPFRYDDPGRALALTARLDAVERYYPYDDDPDPAPVEAVRDRHDLLVTGGSDAHGDTLGRAGLSESAFASLAARLPAPEPWDGAVDLGTGERGGGE